MKDTEAREDEIRKRLEILDRLPPEETVTKMLHADLRYLLEKVERLEVERLKFVSAEEAAKWPENCRAVAASYFNGKRAIYDYWSHWLPSEAARLSRNGWTHFARLPDALPELEGNDGH